MALLFSSPVRVFILSFTQSVTENAKLHQHSSLGRDIFILMHKQALTQHPRGEKTRILFSDVAVPKACCRHKQCRCKQTPVCVWEAHFQQPVGWGCLVSSITWCTTCDLSLQHLEHTASCFPLQAPHHIYISPLCNFNLVCCFSTFALYLYSWQHASRGPLPGFPLPHSLSHVQN